MSDPKAFVAMPYDIMDTENTGIIENKSTQTDKIVRNRMSSGDILKKRLREFKILYNLARVGGINDELEIKKKDGTFNKNSNIVHLLNVTQTSVKSNQGIDDLVYQMHLSKIDPNLIINEIIKSKLMNLNKIDAQTQTDEILNINNINSSNSSHQISDSTNNLESNNERQINSKEVTTQTEENESPANFNIPSTTTVDVAVGPDIGTRITRPIAKATVKRTSPSIDLESGMKETSKRNATHLIPHLFEEPDDKISKENKDINKTNEKNPFWNIPFGLEDE